MTDKNSREYFFTTDRVGFSQWAKEDLPLALLLWGEEEVSRFISKTGVFSYEEILGKLQTEMENQKNYSVQYWPIFCLASGAFMGCCGLRLFGLRTIIKQGEYEIGAHLKSEFWGKGIAKEAAAGVIDFAFNRLNAKTIFAGHNPYNVNSKKVLTRLGFKSAGENFYPPTGLMHPTYKLERNKSIDCESKKIT